MHKADRGLYLTDDTFDRWREVMRRARVLHRASGGASRPTADTVLSEMIEHELRKQDARAERFGVDLKPPVIEDADDVGHGFRGAPRPQCYS